MMWLDILIEKWWRVHHVLAHAQTHTSTHQKSWPKKKVTCSAIEISIKINLDVGFYTNTINGFYNMLNCLVSGNCFFAVDLPITFFLLKVYPTTLSS